MNTVLMISPGYPVEMSYFTRGLAEVGARVIGKSATSVRPTCRPTPDRRWRTTRRSFRWPMPAR